VSRYTLKSCDIVTSIGSPLLGIKIRHSFAHINKIICSAYDLIIFNDTNEIWLFNLSVGGGESGWIKLFSHDSPIIDMCGEILLSLKIIAM